MIKSICNGRPSHPLPDRCGRQTWRYADGLRAALAFCDRVESNYDDTRQVDEMRWHLRRALDECGACEPSAALAAAEGTR